MKLHFFFKINSKSYKIVDDNFNLFIINNDINNKLVGSYSLKKKFLNFDQYSFFLFRNYLYFYLYKQYFFSNILINCLFKYSQKNKFSNYLFNSFFLFNCCFYNFYIENLLFFYKILSNDKNHFFWFFIRTFKKKKKKKLNKKIKKKFFKFKFKRRRFKFKRFRRHTKSFRLKKKKLKKEIFHNSNLIFYYNYISKINNLKKIKTKNVFCAKLSNQFLEKNNLKNHNINYLFNNKFFYYCKSFQRKKITFKKSLSLNLYINIKYFKFKYFKFKFKLKKLNKYKLIKLNYNFYLLNYNFYLNKIIYGFFNKYFNIITYLILFNFFKKHKNYVFFKKIKTILKKKRKTLKRKKIWFFIKNKFFKTKKKYRYNIRSLYYKKHNIKKYNVNKYNPILLKEFYKILFQNLLFNFKLKPSVFMLDSFFKYNIYNFSKLYNDKHSLVKFISKKNLFFKFFKNDNTTILSTYNNHTPVYILNKNFIKKFRKIFKSYFSKKFSNHMYYYVIPMFEYFFKKNIYIKSFNLNIYKKNKNKKKVFYKKLIKIFKRNKALVISRSINFNIFELCEIVLYSFYRKDSYLILN